MMTLLPLAPVEFPICTPPVMLLTTAPSVIPPPSMRSTLPVETMPEEPPPMEMPGLVLPKKYHFPPACTLTVLFVEPMPIEAAPALNKVAFVIVIVLPEPPALEGSRPPTLITPFETVDCVSPDPPML